MDRSPCGRGFRCESADGAACPRLDSIRARLSGAVRNDGDPVRPRPARRRTACRRTTRRQIAGLRKRDRERPCRAPRGPRCGLEVWSGPSRAIAHCCAGDGLEHIGCCGGDQPRPSNAIRLARERRLALGRVRELGDSAPRAAGIGHPVPDRSRARPGASSTGCRPLECPSQPRERRVLRAGGVVCCGASGARAGPRPRPGAEISRGGPAVARLRGDRRAVAAGGPGRRRDRVHRPLRRDRAQLPRPRSQRRSSPHAALVGDDRARAARDPGRRPGRALPAPCRPNDPTGHADRV
jgi:hypothetical protein